jgi:hypothetical protein
MSGLKNTGKRIGNWMQGQGYMTGAEREEKRKAENKARLDKIYAGAEMPDEEVIKRNERRKAAKRRGSAQRNVLTDEDSLG